MKKLKHVVILALAVAALASCAQPEREGPHVTEMPNGFMFDANISSARVVFPSREMGRQLGYMTMKEDHSSVVITPFHGTSDRDDAAGARRTLKNRYSYPEYSELESLTIDEQPAWGWTETQYDRDGEVTAIQYKAVVSYEELDMTYAIEAYSSEERYMDVATLRDMASRFEYGKTEVSDAGVMMGLAAAAGFVGLIMLMGKAEKKQSR